ncbi:MAG: type II toxin-antitoxin system VapC family toxin [Bryobacteraceae bacterium]
MNRFVLDTSVALAWCFEDEQSAQADRILDLLASATAMAPALWPIEVGNALLVAERRRRITAAGVSSSLRLLGSLRIRIDDAGPSLNSEDLVVLARSQNLSVYDAVFLRLAMREGIPLATLDRSLARAARRAGVGVLG